MKKRLPKFKNNNEVENFLARDLSQYQTADNLYPATFEFAPKSKVVNLRIPEALLSAVKQISKRRGIPYQRYIREALEQPIKRTGTRD